MHPNGYHNRISDLLGEMTVDVTKKNSPRLCEESRLVLNESIVSACIQPSIWVPELHAKVERVFKASIDAASAHYRINIQDRYTDYLLLCKTNYIPHSGESSAEPALLRFHVAARNLAKEFQRESDHQDDRSFGRTELLTLCETCDSLLAHLMCQEDCSSELNASVGVKWTNLRTILSEITVLALDGQLPKEKLRRNSLAQLGRMYQEIEVAGRASHTSIEVPTEKPKWWQVLPLAFCTAAAFSQPEFAPVLPGIRQVSPDVLENSAWIDNLLLDLKSTMTSKMEFDREVQQFAHELKITRYADLEALREDLRLQREYPGEWVAFHDIWMAQGNVRLLQRQVLAHHPDFDKMDEQLTDALKHTPIAEEAVRSSYVLDPTAGVGERVTLGEVESSV